MSKKNTNRGKMPTSNQPMLCALTDKIPCSLNMDMEGVVAGRKDSAYIPGKGDDSPLKIPGKKNKSIYLNGGSSWRKYDAAIKGRPVSEFPMKNCTLILHEIERELWEGVCKGDLVLYYHEMADLILPYIKDRPQSLNLKLTTAGGPTTFIKDMENRQPVCADIFSDHRRLEKKGMRSEIDYLVCNNEETLLYMIDYGCVDINPWASRREDAGHPDYIWIDLDPRTEAGDSASESFGFAAAIETARAARELFLSRKIRAFVKTSGKCGLHIYIPCHGFDFRQSRRIANHLADEIHALVPEFTTRKVSISQCRKNVYIDANQNDYADTLAAPYSVRPYHQPLISTPLEWREVRHGLDRYDFNISSIKKRIAKKKDLFAGLLDAKGGRLNQRKLKEFL